MDVGGSVPDYANTKRAKASAVYAEETTSRDEETNHLRTKKRRGWTQRVDLRAWGE